MEKQSIQAHRRRAWDLGMYGGLPTAKMAGRRALRHAANKLALVRGAPWVDGTAGFTPFKFKDSQSDVLKVSAALDGVARHPELDAHAPLGHELLRLRPVPRVPVNPPNRYVHHGGFRNAP